MTRQPDDLLRVLFLEDEPMDVELVRRELERAGFAVDWKRAASRQEYVGCLLSLASPAVGAAAPWRPDVILADFSLPQFSALEALHLLREQDLDIPFIVVTGALSDQSAVDCLRKGAADYLLKDRLSRLGPTVRGVLEERRARAQAPRLLEAQSRFASAGDPARVLRFLVEQAVQPLGGDDGGVARWDPERQVLTQVESYLPSRSAGTILSLDHSASGLVVRTRRPVLVDDYQRQAGRSTPAGAAGAEAVVAAPLLSEGRLLGTIAVSTFSAEKRFVARHAEILEMLASLAAATLEGLERAHLRAASLTAREVAHLINNDLAVPLLNLSLPCDEQRLSEEARQWLAAAESGVRAAAVHVRQLQRLIRFRTKDTGVSEALDLEQSSQA